MSFFTFLSEFLSGHPDAGRQGAGDRPDVGAVYRHREGVAPVEYAEVTGLRADGGGIRHVRFELILGYRDKVVPAGERTLSVECFARRFPERFDTRSDKGVGQTPDHGAEPVSVGDPDGALRHARQA